MTVTVSMGSRRVERMSPARWRGIPQLIDGDVTRAGRGGEQRMDGETRERGSVRQDEECENRKQMCLQPPGPLAPSFQS